MIGYVLDYFDEIEFAKLTKSLKKYNQAAFEKLMLQYYPYLKSGKFIGEIINKDEVNNTETYEVKLPSTKLFAMIHGEIKLRYIVSFKQNIVMLDSISPSDLFLEASMYDLEIYRDVVVSKANLQKNKLSIDMILSEKKDEDLLEIINGDAEASKCICPHCNGTGYIN